MPRLGASLHCGNYLTYHGFGYTAMEKGNTSAQDAAIAVSIHDQHLICEPFSCPQHEKLEVCAAVHTLLHDLKVVCDWLDATRSTPLRVEYFSTGCWHSYGPRAMTTLENLDE